MCVSQQVPPSCYQQPRQYPYWQNPNPYMLRDTTYLAAQPSARPGPSQLPSTHEQPSHQQGHPIRPSVAPFPNMVRPHPCLFQRIHVLCVLGSSILLRAIPLPADAMESLHIPAILGKEINIPSVHGSSLFDHRYVTSHLLSNKNSIVWNILSGYGHASWYITQFYALYMYVPVTSDDSSN